MRKLAIAWILFFGSAAGAMEDPVYEPALGDDPMPDVGAQVEAAAGDDGAVAAAIGELNEGGVGAPRPLDESADPAEPGLVDPAFEPDVPGGGDPDFDPQLPIP